MSKPKCLILSEHKISPKSKNSLTACVIIEKDGDIVYTAMYSHLLEDYDCKNSETTSIIDECNKFYSYWEE